MENQSVPDRRPVLEVRGLGKSFATSAGPRQVINDLSFELYPGEFVCLVGPSGAGKTTLLRCLAGLTTPSDGSVLFEGVSVSGTPQKMALVFQDYGRSLMPWLTILDNVTLPLRGRMSRSERNALAHEALADVGLVDVDDHYPWQLSGGMQQRVAIARGLAYEPDVLVMDEPFAAVDAQTRADLEDLMLDLQRRRNVTILLVTHDIDEAIYLSSRVIVLSGRPAKVSEVIAVDLPAERDQVATKALPQFAKLRGHVFTLIKNARQSQVVATGVPSA